MEELDLGEQRPASKEDLKRWYIEAHDKNFKLEEEIKMLKEVIKAQAAYIASM